MFVQPTIEKTLEQKILEGIHKIETGKKNIGYVIRNGFYPMVLFECVKERENHRYCGDCYIYDMCRMLGWIVHVFHINHVRQSNNDHVKDDINKILDDCLEILNRDLHKVRTGKGKDISKEKYIMRRGLPRKKD